MRWMLIAVAVCGCGPVAGDAPLVIHPYVETHMHYLLASGSECEASANVLRDQYLQILRPVYADCRRSEILLGGVVVDATLDCTNLTLPPNGGIADVCEWTPPD